MIEDEIGRVALLLQQSVAAMPLASIDWDNAVQLAEAIIGSSQDEQTSVEEEIANWVRSPAALMFIGAAGGNSSQ